MLDRDVREMPKIYVTKDDFHRDLSEIKDICRQIFDKLDGKADNEMKDWLIALIAAASLLWLALWTAYVVISYWR